MLWGPDKVLIEISMVLLVFLKVVLMEIDQDPGYLWGSRGDVCVTPFPPAPQCCVPPMITFSVYYHHYYLTGSTMVWIDIWDISIVRLKFFQKNC